MTMTTTDRQAVIDAVESYVRGLGGGDLSGARLAPDVTYEGPMASHHGREALVEVLSGLFPVITGVDVLDHVVEDDVCATRFDLHTTAGTVHVFDRFVVRGGQVATIRPYYDPAPLFAALDRHRSGGRPAVRSIHHAALTVTDADRSAAWYRALFGLDEVLRGDDEEVSFRVLAGPSVMVGVRQYHRVAGHRFDEFRTGLDHLAFEVSSRDELDRWERLLAERRIPYSPIADTPIGSVIVLRDPDNIQLELWLPA